MPSDDPYATFAERARTVLDRMAAACVSCGRSPAEVRLLPVTKFHPAAAAIQVARFGLPAVGENRVQEARDKRPLVDPGLRWELIGHLQSNKAKLAVQVFDRIQTVDSVKLAQFLDRASGELGKMLPILLQINAGDDPNKEGADVADSGQLLEAALACPNLVVEGLMTIAPLDSNPAVAEHCFVRLRETRDDLSARFGVKLPELSMGMSGDLEAAIRAGSTLVRVGTALFGERPAPVLSA